MSSLKVIQRRRTSAQADIRIDFAKKEEARKRNAKKVSSKFDLDMCTQG